MRVVISSFAALAIVALVSSVQGAPADDDAAAQSVIRAQEQAFARDDAFTAYSFAAPAIRNIFAAADIFMAMVRHAYAPVYRHRSFEFGVTTHLADGRIEQRVHIIDADGVAWEALYSLELQADGSLKITACVLTQAIEI